MIPRLRVIAGPNGSGKTTLASRLAADYAVNFYHFLNADLLLAELLKSGKTTCPFPTADEELMDFVRNTSYASEYKRPFLDGEIAISSEEHLTFSPSSINSYTVAMVCDFFKEQYLSRRLSFSFETVFSHPAKLAMLQKAQSAGYRTYLYFVATEDPAINIDRISSRVALKGHDVPEEKTRERYTRCLNQVNQALPFLNRAFFFDNSGDHQLFLAEYESPGRLLLHSDVLPVWFRRYVLGE